MVPDFRDSKNSLCVVWFEARQLVNGWWIKLGGDQEPIEVPLMGACFDTVHDFLMKWLNNGFWVRRNVDEPAVSSGHNLSWEEIGAQSVTHVGVTHGWQCDTQMELDPLAMLHTFDNASNSSDAHWLQFNTPTWRTHMRSCTWMPDDVPWQCSSPMLFRVLVSPCGRYSCPTSRRWHDILL